MCSTRVSSGRAPTSTLRAGAPIQRKDVITIKSNHNIRYFFASLGEGIAFPFIPDQRPSRRRRRRLSVLRSAQLSLLRLTSDAAAASFHRSL